MNPIFYKKPIIIDKNKHLNWGFKPVENYSFAKSTNIIPLVTSEFEISCKEYPIVFIKKDNKFSPVLLLSLRSKINNFVDNNGNWLANYVPAYVRRYPFILAEKDSKNKENLILCIDSDYSGFSPKKAKFALFTSKSEPSETLNQAIDLLNQYHVSAKKTESFCSTMKKMGLFKKSVVVAKNKQILDGFYSIERKSFDKLNNEDICKLRESGHLSLIFAHFISMISIKNIT